MSGKAENDANRARISWEAWIKGVTTGAQEAWDSGREFYVVTVNLGGT